MAKVAWLRQNVKHVIFINKENATHDLLLGDITRTASGQPVRGEPTYSLGEAASPNGYLVTKHISLESIFKTVDLILGVPPLNLYDASAADLLELWPDPKSGRDGDRATADYGRAEMKYDTRNAIAWERATRHIDFGTPDSKELVLRDAIRSSQGLPRKKAEGRFDD